MIMAKFTRGPWLFRSKSGSIHAASDTHPYGVEVLSPVYEWESGCDIEVSADDLALILAAPDIYEALKNLLKIIDGEESTDLWCVAARKALAKAEGKS